MSGHSKWATIKHKKGAADAARGKLFAKLIRQVEVAAREGGGDPDMNPTLRTMYQKARDASVPLDTIERAIKRGTGDLEGVIYEPITYEGYAPGGVAVLIEVLTDNRNRTGAEVRSVFTKFGGSMAEPGAVAWQFERKGTVLADRGADEDDLMLARPRRRRRGPRRRRRGVAGHHPAHRAARRAHRPRGGRGDGRVGRAHDAARPPPSPSTPARRPRRCCASSTRSRTTTTCRTSTPTSTSPTTSSRGSTPDGARRSASRRPTSPWRAATTPTRAGATTRSRSTAGRPVVLVFYPGDSTPVCTRQLNSYTEDIDSFAEAGAQVLAISPAVGREPRRLLLQAGRLRLPAARRHRQGGGRGLRHPRPARLLPALGVRGRRRGRRPLRPPGRRRPHVPQHRRARRRP